MVENYLIYVGLFLRYVYYILAEQYTMEFLKAKLWKSLIMSFLFSSVLVYVSFYGHFIEQSTSTLIDVFIMLAFVFTGWASDSVFLSLMKLYEQKFQKKIEE